MKNKKEEEISIESFCVVCFAVLMENDKGIISKSPEYIREKKAMLRFVNYRDAFGLLDSKNQQKVLSWLKKWDIEVPEEIKNSFHYLFTNN